MAQSVITQVSRDGDSYTPCPVPPSDKGSINTAATASTEPTKRDKFKSFCMCQWLISCFKRDETTPVDSIPQDHTSPELIEERQYLLPARPPSSTKKCVVIDLDETLVHSSFKPVANADFIVPVEIDGTIHQVYVLKRPNVDEFLRRMGEMFECVLFTASLSKYADPVADLLDKYRVFDARLFRESCVFHKGNYVKDLSRLGRDLREVVIIDNSPQSYIFHPDNAVPVSSWFDDPRDTELLDLLPFFEALEKVDNVLTVLGQGNNYHSPAHASPQHQIALQQQHIQQQQQQRLYQHHQQQ